MSECIYPESFRSLPDICYMSVADFLPIHRDEWHNTRRSDLIYVISGELTIVLPGASELKYPAGPGEVVMMPSNQPHRDIFKLRKGLKALIISYWWQGDEDFFHSPHTGGVIKFAPENLHEVRWQLERLCEISRNRDKFHANDLLTQSRMHTVLLLLYQILQQGDLNEPRSSYRAQELLKAAENYIKCNYASPALNRSGTAAALSVSVATLSRAFERYSGYTFNEYLTEVRLEAARKLLHDGCRVSEAATRCGFADAGYFARVFKKVHGISPGKYR